MFERTGETMSEFDALQELEERFLRYVQINTRSDETSATTPSTDAQYDLLNLLVEELIYLGAAEVKLTEYGTVLATIPATADGNQPVVAFLAHVDTAADIEAANVKPIVHRAYDGRDIVLPDDTSQVLSTADIPYLAERVGDDIVTASGLTLLGADDKAGVAIVMAMANHLLEHPEIPHGKIRVAFTPDEEIGRGVDPRLPADLGADFAYTLDGADRGEIVFETFSADKGTVTIEGVSIHPGEAKDHMVNALQLAAKIVDALPQSTRTPATTDGLQGFIHLYAMHGTAGAAELHFILRDFDNGLLNDHGTLLQKVCDAVAAGEPRAKITCEITPQYRNMRYWLEQDMRPVDIARAAADGLGIAHHSNATRGGTDGSRLTEMGVPTPNLFTGMQNFHGPLEWVSLQDMNLSTALLIEIARLWGSESK